jgi:hypothetical protein
MVSSVPVLGVVILVQQRHAAYFLPTFTRSCAVPEALAVTRFQGNQI